MTMMVTSAAAPRAIQRARKRRPAGAGMPAPAPNPATTQVIQQLNAAAAPAPAAPAPAAGAPATAATPAPAEPAPPTEPEKSPEYDPVDYAGEVGGIVAGTTTEFVGPHISKAVTDYLNKDRFPVLGTPYGAVIPGKVAGTLIGQVGGFVGSVVADALAGVTGGEGKPGLGWTPTPPNKLIAGTAKGIITTWMKMALTDALKPPPPPPPPVYPPDVKPLPQPPAPTPPPPKKVLLTDVDSIKASVTSGLIGMGISTLYDQTVGPLVQRAANIITGRGDEPIKAPAPLTPGRVVNGLVDSVLGSMLVRSVSYTPLPGGPPPGPTPFAGALGASLINGVLGAAWSTVYNRGLGTSIENGVNQLAGIRPKEEAEKAKLPALEHFTRAATRGVAVGATTYVLGNALNATMIKLGASIGGVGGALVAVAGAALIGSIGGTVVDATIGPMLGKLGGQIYSWISGKPTYEQRIAEAAKKAPVPGPTPGDPVKAPNGNPGTVPAPSAPAAPAAPAPAAPATGKPKRRRRTGNAAVDRTAPAINVSNARLAAIAARG